MRIYPLNLLASSPRRRRALTLIELITALTVTALIGAVISVLINATAAGTNTQNDGRRSLVKMQTIKAQIEDLIMNSQCVLATGSNYLVLWTGDISGAVTPVNGAVNLSELELLEVDTNTGNINLYTTSWPSNFDNAHILSNDSTYAASTSWYSACTTAKAGSYFTAQTLGTSATGMTVALDSATCTSAKLVSLVLTFTDASKVDRKVVIGAAIENQAAPW